MKSASSRTSATMHRMAPQNGRLTLAVYLLMSVSVMAILQQLFKRLQFGRDKKSIAETVAIARYLAGYGLWLLHCATITSGVVHGYPSPTIVADDRISLPLSLWASGAVDVRWSAVGLLQCCKGRPLDLGL